LNPLKAAVRANFGNELSGTPDRFFTPYIGFRQQGDLSRLRRHGDDEAGKDFMVFWMAFSRVRGIMSGTQDIQI
jgi:hypothetical protein